MNIRDIVDYIFNLPKDFLAWILYHVASWLDMTVIPNEDIEEYIWKEMEDFDIEEEEEEDDEI